MRTLRRLTNCRTQKASPAPENAILLRLNVSSGVFVLILARLVVQAFNFLKDLKERGLKKKGDIAAANNRPLHVGNTFERAMFPSISNCCRKAVDNAEVRSTGVTGLLLVAAVIVNAGVS